MAQNSPSLFDHSAVIHLKGDRFMPEPITVLVAGATGEQGGTVARLLVDQGQIVRMSMGPLCTAQSLGASGVGICERGLEGRESVGGEGALLPTGIPLEGMPSAEATSAELVASTIEKAGAELLASSGARADGDAGLRCFESACEMETRIAGLGVPYTIVGPASFVEQLLSVRPRGLRAVRPSPPWPPCRQVQVIAVSDIARFVRLVAERPSLFQGRRIEIDSALSGSEMASILSRVAGAAIEFARGPRDVVGDESEGLARVLDWFGRIGHGADIPVLVRDYRELGWDDVLGRGRERDWSVLKVARPEQQLA